MCFMIVYLVCVCPASWIIDTYGIRAGVGTVLCSRLLFGMMRGFASEITVCFCWHRSELPQDSLSFSIPSPRLQPGGFPSKRERQPPAGTLAMYFGILLGISLTPFLANGHG